MRQFLLVAFLVCSTPLLAGAQEGVAIKVLAEGVGPEIETGQVAVVSYRLKTSKDVLVEVRSVRDPFRFEVGSRSVVSGFATGVAGMKVGERREVTVPPNLGYGDRDSGLVPANSVLIFDIELLQISNEEPLGFSPASTLGDSSTVPTEDLSELMRKDDFLNARHAHDVTKPAMFEFLIRDFFTKPWRYADGHTVVWRSTARAFLVLSLVLMVALMGVRRGYWIL